MTAFYAQLRDDSEDLGQKRYATRRSLRLNALAPTSSADRYLLISNLSETGMMIESSAAIEIGERITIELPNAGQTTAEVVWQSHHLHGCRFDEPISTATISAALLRSPPEQRDFEVAGPDIAPLSPFTRFSIIVGLTLALWGLCFLAVWPFI